MILGITGGTGCGKTTLLEEIHRRGGLVLDCDAIYHTLLKTDTALLDALAHRFPTAFSDGTLDRKALGRIVFSDPEALSDLNRITHGAIFRSVEERLAEKPALAAIDAIALFESGLNRLCDVTVAVTAPEEKRIERLMLRDAISRDYAVSRIRAQKPQDWFTARTDDTLENNENISAFRNRCAAFLDKLNV